MHRAIYKICDRTLWAEAEAKGIFEGAEIDLQDGYIHFSTAQQLEQTLALHFAGRQDLVLIEVDTTYLDLVWEPARDGQLFPHLYGQLEVQAARAVWPLTLSKSGQHILPNLADKPAQTD